MMKKLISLAGAGAILLSAAVPAFAHLRHFGWGSRDVAVVDNTAFSVANTGGNSQNNSASVNTTCHSGARAGSTGNRNMDTGNADAYAGAVVVANTHVGCDTCGRGSHRDFANVSNWADAESNTGYNHQNDSASAYMTHRSNASAGSTGNRNMNTGKADSESHAWTVVNTHLSFGMVY